jgi:hypothetical protein
MQEADHRRRRAEVRRPNNDKIKLLDLPRLPRSHMN